MMKQFAVFMEGNRRYMDFATLSTPISAQNQLRCQAISAQTVALDTLPFALFAQRDKDGFTCIGASFEVRKLPLAKDYHYVARCNGRTPTHVKLILPLDDDSFPVLNRTLLSRVVSNVYQSIWENTDSTFSPSYWCIELPEENLSCAANALRMLKKANYPRTREHLSLHSLIIAFHHELLCSLRQKRPFRFFHSLELDIEQICDIENDSVVQVPFTPHNEYEKKDLPPDTPPSPFPD